MPGKKRHRGRVLPASSQGLKTLRDVAGPPRFALCLTLRSRPLPRDPGSDAQRPEPSIEQAFAVDVPLNLAFGDLVLCQALLWPVGLSGFYDTPYVVKPGISNFVVPLLAVGSIAVALGMVAWRSTWNDRRAIGFAVAWLVLPILPLLNLSVFREAEIVHDRYLYMPSIGFSILVALALARLRAGQSKLFGRPALQVLLVVALTGALGFGTASQHIHWASNLVLYHHSLSVAPNNDVAANDLANELSKRGFYDDAIALYQQVLARQPNHWAATYDLGCNYYLQGEYEAALPYLIRGVEMRPAEPRQYLTLAVTLEEMNRLNDAERAIRRAIEIQPQGTGFNYELGDLLKAQGKLRPALDAYKAEAAYNPGYKKTAEHISEIEARLARGETDK